jgi:hypothetical protein
VWDPSRLTTLWPPPLPVNRDNFTITLYFILWPPLWSSGQSSWLQIQRSGSDSWRYQIFREMVGLERGSLWSVSTIEELLEPRSSSSGLENPEYGRGDPSRWPRGTLYLQKLALPSPTSCGLSVGIVLSRTQATEFFLLYSAIFSLPFHTEHGVIAFVQYANNRLPDSKAPHPRIKCTSNVFRLAVACSAR